MKIQEFKSYARGTIIVPQRTGLILPTFNLAPDDWSGASRMLLEIPVNNDYLFSLKLPIRRFGVNFMMAIRWEENGVVSRYKLWEDIGEVLYYPLYSGQRIGLNAVFEVWSIETSAGYLNPVAKTLYTSVLLFASGCECTLPSLLTTLVANDSSSIISFPNPFDGQEQEIDPTAPGGEIPVSTDIAGDWYVFPTSGYGKDSAGNTSYPNNITALEASFWELLLDNEWNITEFSERRLVWYYYGHSIALRDFDTRYLDGSPIPNLSDPITTFALPWTLTYLWRP
jgi:hypothetical protein